MRDEEWEGREDFFPLEEEERDLPVLLPLPLLIPLWLPLVSLELVVANALFLDGSSSEQRFDAFPSEGPIRRLAGKMVERSVRFFCLLVVFFVFVVLLEFLYASVQYI